MSSGTNPLGCRTEVPVALVSLPVKWEQGFPKVLLALVYNVCCFLPRTVGLPPNQDGDSPASPCQPWPSQPDMERPDVGPGLCVRPGAAQGHSQPHVKACSGRQAAGLAVYRHVGSSSQSSGAAPPPWDGLGEAAFPSSVIPLSLCWCLGPKVWVEWRPGCSCPTPGTASALGGVSGQTWGCPRWAWRPKPRI